jgi:hypothetical protein
MHLIYMTVTILIVAISLTHRSITIYEKMKKFTYAVVTNRSSFATEMSDATTYGLDFTNASFEWLSKKKERSHILKGFSLSRQRWISAIQKVILRLRVYKIQILLQKYDIEYVGCDPDLAFGLTPVELFHSHCRVKVGPPVKPRQIFCTPPNKDDRLPLLSLYKPPIPVGKHYSLRNPSSCNPSPKTVTTHGLSPQEASSFSLDDKSPIFMHSFYSSTPASPRSKKFSLHKVTILPSPVGKPHNASPERMSTTDLSSRDMKPHTPERTLRKRSSGNQSPHTTSPERISINDLSSRDVEPHTPGRTPRKRSPCERERRLKNSKKDSLLPSIILKMTSKLDIAGPDLVDSTDLRSLNLGKIQFPCLQ